MNKIEKVARVRKSKTELPGEKACHHVASAPGLHCRELELKALFAASVGGEKVETGQDPTPFVTRVTNGSGSRWYSGMDSRVPRPHDLVGRMYSASWRKTHWAWGVVFGQGYCLSGS